MKGFHSRRQFLQGSLALAGLGLLSGCGVVPPPTKQPAKVGVLLSYSLDPSPEGSAFRQAMRDLGYSEGQNLTIVPRYGSGKEALASRAAELVGLPVDVIVAVGNAPTRVAKEATATIPIVMADSSDPVGEGLVASLGRPGGNVTGLTSFAAELGAKRLDLLRETVPGLSRVAVLWVSNRDESPDWRETQAAAQSLGVQLQPLQVRGSNFLDGAFESATRGRVDGLIVLTDNTRNAEQSLVRLVGFAANMGLPAIYESQVLVESGGLMAYGPNRDDIFRRVATYVDKILKGAKPGDLPIEQPTTFDFIINLKTAQALGLVIPPSVLQQATEVIQ